MNSLRFPETPAHYSMEASRLTNEIDLWERWVEAKGTEDGFQQWLDEPFGGQPEEDALGQVVAGTAVATGASRRSVLVWNLDEVLAELEQALAGR